MTSDDILTESEEPDDVTRFHSWIAGHKDYSDATAHQYRQAARRWAAWVEYDSPDELERDPEELDFTDELKDALFTPNDADLLEPEPRDVEDFFIDLRGYLAPKTMSTTRAGLNTFLRFRGPWDDPQPGGSSSYPDQTPADKAKIGTWNADSVKSEEQRQSVHFLEREQVDDLLANVPEPTVRNKLLLRIMLQTGVRASEVATIRCGPNPDWESNDLMDIDREDRTIQIKDKKSDGYRTVVYQDSLDSLLRLWVETERETVYGSDQSEYLFVTKDGDHINPQYVNRVVKRAADNAGIQRPYSTTANGYERASVTSHVLRHTFAMHALRNELDTHWIKEQLGHDDISTTIDMYLHEDEETMKEKVGDLGPSFQ